MFSHKTMSTFVLIFKLLKRMLCRRLFGSAKCRIIVTLFCKYFFKITLQFIPLYYEEILLQVEYFASFWIVLTFTNADLIT